MVERFYIRVPSPYAFLVTCGGQEVTNWRDLMKEAQQAAEPELRARWKRYHQLLELNTRQALAKDATLEEIMLYLCTPSMEYDCPPELAAKAIVAHKEGKL